MTECERIISKGIITEDFLEEEKRCDFFVDKKRKKIWMIELDLLLEFDRVCKKYNLKYFLIDGSLLGAIRHNGFIPWDDDIDIGMLRDDYNKLLSINPAEFSMPYFFQTPATDKGSGFSFAKIRNSNTTGMSKAFQYEKFNQGICIDIFPFDNCDTECSRGDYDAVKKLARENSISMRKSHPDFEKVFGGEGGEYSGRDMVEVYGEINKIAQKYSGIKTKYIRPAVSAIYPYENGIHLASSLDEIILHKFENLSFPIPKGYDCMLREQYGDYMKYPPVSERGIRHDGSIYDPDKPYTEYIK